MESLLYCGQHGIPLRGHREVEAPDDSINGEITATLSNYTLAT